MNVIDAFLTKNPCYTAGKTIKVKGLMLHSVGCSQPSAQVFINAWNKPTYNAACVHGFIDANTGDVYQTLPWDHRGWHGGGSVNNTHIGVEICEPATITYPKTGVNFTDNNPSNSKAAVQRTYMSAVSLFAMLCKRFKLDPLADGVIISHNEGGKRGIATQHVDPEHLWGRYGYTMDGFRTAVAAAVGSENVQEAEKPAAGAPYIVRITRPTPVLKEPATMLLQTGGAYTIVEERDGFGRLKSGAGWVDLADTEKR